MPLTPLVCPLQVCTSFCSPAPPLPHQYPDRPPHKALTCHINAITRTIKALTRPINTLTRSIKTLTRSINTLIRSIKALTRSINTLTRPPIRPSPAPSTEISYPIPTPTLWHPRQQRPVWGYRLPQQ